MFYQTWLQKNPELKSVQDVVEHNTCIKIQEFLNPKRNPFLSNLTEAVAFVKSEIEQDSTVSIVGDYDVDGVCATTIMYLGIMKYSGVEPHVRIPRRFSEGYGISTKIINEIESGLVITVDNGIAALEQIRVAKEKGLKVLVTDHHLPIMDEDTGKTILPDADIIVDPHAVPGSEFCDYCGAAIAYRFIEELIPNETELLEHCKAFAGLATVADVMPLIGDNRNFVIDSLDLVRNRKVTLGLNTLLNELNLSYVTEGDYGFKLGPVINAAGRLYDDGPMHVFELLKTHLEAESPDYTKTLFWCQEQSKELKKWNKERQDLTYESMIRAEKILEANGLKSKIPIVLYDPECSEGIIGIVAGQLAEKYRTPALVFTDSHTKGVIKGSGRNYGNVHLKKLLDKAKDIFVGYGGHAGAAGMSVELLRLGELAKRLQKELQGVDFGVDPETFHYDLRITPKEAAFCIQELKKYAPFGEGNPPITFRIDGFDLSPRAGKFCKYMGNREQHIKFYGDGISAVAFDMRNEYEKAEQPKRMNFVGSLSQNFFNGTFYNQIEVVDFEPIVSKKTDTFTSLESLLMFT